MTAPKFSEAARKACWFADKLDHSWPGVACGSCDAIQAAIDDQAKPLAEALRDTLRWVREVGAEVNRSDYERLGAARKALEAYEESR